MRLVSCEENSGLKINKEKDVFVFELANDDVDDDDDVLSRM